ncbi:MAG TPA: response regulator [Chthoniobacterales bacterium]|nr:response regulator [Chthoniobacterales bacterium]
MKNILLVADGTSSSTSTAARAALECHRGLRHANTSHDAFEILAEDINDIDVVILDVDSGAHRLCFLDAISCYGAAPPVIVVTDSQDTDVTSKAYRHGATACIGKPFTSRELGALIDDVVLPEWQRSGGVCDRWGHPQRGIGRHRIGHSHDRLHALSL